MNAAFPYRDRWLFGGVLAVALVVRLGAGLWWQERLPADQKFFFPDSDGYWQLGQAVAAGQPFQYQNENQRIFRTPGYPVLLAGWFRLTSSGEPTKANILLARALSAMLGTLAVGLVGWLAYLLAGSDPATQRNAALLALSIATIYPEAVALSVFILSEAPFCPLMVLQLIAWTLALRVETSRGQWQWGAVAGMSAGLATLMRPSWLLFTPFAAGWLFLLLPKRRKQITVLAAMLVLLCVTMSPWWLRSYQITGKFIPSTLQVGASLYDGLSPTATGASEMEFVKDFRQLQQLEDQKQIASGQMLVGTFEERLDNSLRQSSLQWARANPGKVISLMQTKFLRMWNPWPNAADFRSTSLRMILACTYTPLILLALLSLLQYARRRWLPSDAGPLLCLLPAIYFTCLHTIFVSSIRYRQPAMLPLIAVIAACFVSQRLFGKVPTTNLVP